MEDIGAEEYGLEFLDSAIEDLLQEGIGAVDDEIIVTDKENNEVGCLFRLTSTTRVDNPHQEFGDFLEKEGYDRGKSIASASYSADLDPEGIRKAINQPYVEAAELSRPAFIG